MYSLILMGLFVIFTSNIEWTHQHLKLSEALKNYFSPTQNILTFRDQFLALFPAFISNACRA